MPSVLLGIELGVLYTMLSALTNLRDCFVILYSDSKRVLAPTFSLHNHLNPPTAFNLSSVNLGNHSTPFVSISLYKNSSRQSIFFGLYVSLHFRDLTIK